MTKDEMKAGLLRAYELLAYGIPDPDLTNSVSGPRWVEQADEWLVKFAPSRLGQEQVEPTGKPVVACIYRDGCRKFPTCMNEARCCARDSRARQAEPTAKPETHQGPLHQAVEDLGFWLLTRKAHEAEERGEQRIPCFVQIEWVERVAKLLGYAYPPENRGEEHGRG